MTLADFGTIAEIVSAIAVVATLAFLTLQIRHANKLGQLQTRAKMVELTGIELTAMSARPHLNALITKPSRLTQAEINEVYFFLIQIMRQREWEWYQANNGALSKADAEQVKRECLEVSTTYLSYRRARKWWTSLGQFGFHPQFVADIARHLESTPDFRIDLAFLAVEDALEEEDKVLAASRPRKPSHSVKRRRTVEVHP